MENVRRDEPLFELINNMSKAEKRNFKIYATGQAGNREVKYVALFDYLDSVDQYCEQDILKNCPITKTQLPNIKAHLYKQLLVSIRMLNVRHSEIMQLREQLDFAQLLYDKGLYAQSDRVLEKAKEDAELNEEYAALLSIVDFQNKIDTMSMPKNMASTSGASTRRVGELCRKIEANSELSDTATRAYALYQQLGYARTQKDLDLIVQYFKPKLNAYADRVDQMSFYEKFYYYQALAWYYYIQQNFVLSYRYGRLWVELFDSHPVMKTIMYDNYIKGGAHLLDGLYLMRKPRQLAEYFVHFEREFETVSKLNLNAFILSKRVIYGSKINLYFLTGEFEKGLTLVEEIDEFIDNYSQHLDLHYKMLLYYKMACLYFGAEEYEKCIEYLKSIISTKDPQIRRDLQCFSRILNLIASYEAGIDYNLDRQIRSVYSFLVKMNDMQAVQKEMMIFLKNLGDIYADDLKEELTILYERLKPYENHPYERRTFYYLDILSWLESKITDRSVVDIVQEKYLAIK